MNLYKESDLKAAFSCNFLYHVGGTLNTFDKTQLLFIKVLKELYTLLIKNELSSLDDDLFKIIKANIYKEYPSITIDDSQTLINYLINCTYAFIRKFPLTDYTPVFVDLNPTISLRGKNIELAIDILFKQNNKSSFLHAIKIVSKIDDYSVKYDYFNHLKLQFLKNSYSNRRYSSPPTRLHICSIAPLQYRNKNLKYYTLKTKCLTEKDINKTYIKNLSYNIDLILSNQNPIPIPACNNYNCSYRKQCISTI